MATSTRLSLSEYMKTSYRPDREYVDGELLERNVGKWEHARLQALLAAVSCAGDSDLGYPAEALADLDED